MKAKDFFENLDTRLMKDHGLLVMSGIRSKLIVVVLTDLDQAWTLKFDENRLAYLIKGAGPFDCLIEMNGKTFDRLTDNDLNITLAVFMGKIKIRGDRILAATVGKALQKLA